MITHTELGEIVSSHNDSLPRTPSPHGWWLSFVIFGAVPAGSAAAMAHVDRAPLTASSSGLMAGVGVLGGLLFQVLAWLGGRLGALADDRSGLAPSPRELQLIEKLSIARANIAYASLVSIVFVVELGFASMLRKPAAWLDFVSIFLLVHLGFTLILVVERINRIGKSDRLTARSRKAIADSER